jgi:hypothetical protein
MYLNADPDNTKQGFAIKLNVEPEPGAEEPKINYRPGGGAEFANCGSGCGSSSGSGSFLFTTDLKKFYRKESWLLTVLWIRIH